MGVATSKWSEIMQQRVYHTPVYTIYDVTELKAAFGHRLDWSAIKNVLHRLLTPGVDVFVHASQPIDITANIFYDCFLVLTASATFKQSLALYCLACISSDYELCYGFLHFI